MIDKWKEWLDKQFSGGQHKKLKYMLIIAAIGLLFIIVSNLFTSTDKREVQPRNPELSQDDQQLEEVSLTENIKDLEGQYESELESMLNQIKGVSNTEVMVNVDSTNVQVYEKDLIRGSQTTNETDKNGGTRSVEDESEETKLVHVRRGDEEVPVLVQTRKPEVRGIFVIAEGAEQAKVKKWIIESVSRVLDVPTYRISVMPK